MLLRTWMLILNKIGRLAWNPLRYTYDIEVWQSSAVSLIYNYSFGLHR